MSSSLPKTDLQEIKISYFKTKASFKIKWLCEICKADSELEAEQGGDEPQQSALWQQR